MSGLPEQFSFLEEGAPPPKMVAEALKHLGTIEALGTANNTKIVGWADEIGKVCNTAYSRWAADFYNKDSIPWCGLFCALVAARTAGGNPARLPPKEYLAALSWANWGQAASSNDIRVGDIIVLTRPGGGHVFIALGASADGEYVTGIGGNQGDAVTIATFGTANLCAVRRPLYSSVPPSAVKRIINFKGVVETRMA